MLIDEIRAASGGGGSVPVWPVPPTIDEALVLDVTAVHDYLVALHGEGTVRLVDGYREFPNLAPLAPVMWFEWRTRLSHIGVPMTIVAQEHQGALTPLYDLGSIEDDVLRAATDRGARWAYLCGVLGRCFDRADLVRRDMETLLLVAPDGSGVAINHLWASDNPPSRDEIAVHQGHLSCALMALCFAHCKGVTTTEHHQPRQQRRAAERAGRPPLVTYKTIDIAPVTRILREEGQVDKNGPLRAMHICRGNFAHYPPGHYFGRNPEPVTVFRPMHVRGNPDAGLALKDYRVLPSPPSEDT